MYPYIIQGGNITVVIGNQPHTVSKTHVTYERVKQAIIDNDWETVKNIIEPKKMVLNYGRGNVSIKGETLYWKDRELHNALATRMISMLTEGFPIEPMVNFMENLMKNPSRQAVQELYGFLEKNNLPITPCGSFLAYKRVRDDYLDCHSGTMDNSIGKIVEMERNEVDDNRDNTCSSGLHFCAHSYLAHFSGARTVIVKINPADVVSIPSDYNDAKGRACRYEVIGEVGVNPEDEVEFTKAVQSNANSVIDLSDELVWDFENLGAEWSVPDGDINITYDNVNITLDDWEGDSWITEDDPTKKGSGMFYRGYSDGYNGEFAETVFKTPAGEKFYTDGYEQGRDDYLFRVQPRYVYVENTNATESEPPVNKWPNDAVWPFPKSSK